MLGLIFLIAVAAADPIVERKILTLYEDAIVPHTIPDTKTALRSWCMEDCHYHIMDKALMIVTRSAEGKFVANYIPMGLNHVGKSEITMPIKEMLAAKGVVGIISPLAKFPFELFPGLLDTDIVIPEHHSKLSYMYKEAPILALLPEEEFKMFNEKRGYKIVADIAIDDKGFSVLKDYAQVNRNSILTRESAPGLYYLVPTGTSHDVTPTTSGLVPLTSSEYIRYMSAARPITNPALKTFFF